MNKKVFFVDDEKNVLNSIKRLFRKTDFEIFISTDPFEAVKMLSEVEPSVVVSDYRMPQMTGLSFFEKVKCLYPGTIRIILSAYTDIAVTEAAMNRAAIDLFIQKPWDKKELLVEVSNAVNLYHFDNSNGEGYGIF